MEIAKLMVSGPGIQIVKNRSVPAGLVGGYITVEYGDSVWNNLSKTMVFCGETMKDVVAIGSTVIIPHEVVSAPGKRLKIGIYGTLADGTKVLPTFWADLGLIAEATDPSGDTESINPSLPVWAQLAERMEVLEQAGTGKPGADGADGGYYVPAAYQKNDNILEVKFTASKADMPAVKTVEVMLPAGHTPVKGEDYFTQTEKQEMITAVLSALPVWEGGSY